MTEKCISRIDSWRVLEAFVEIDKDDLCMDLGNVCITGGSQKLAGGFKEWLMVRKKQLLWGSEPGNHRLNLDISKAEGRLY